MGLILTSLCIVSMILCGRSLMNLMNVSVASDVDEGTDNLGMSERLGKLECSSGPGGSECTDHTHCRDYTVLGSSQKLCGKL